VIDSDQIIFAAGNQLVLQSLEDPGAFCILPQHDSIHTLLGIEFHAALQVLSTAAVMHDK
jgi:hypothetical protein